MLRAPPLWPLPRRDIILGLAPLRLLHRILGQPRGPHHPRGPGPRAQGSHPLRDLGRHPHRLIRALSELRTYPLHLLSGGPSSLAAPSQGMLTTMGEISTGRFTTISRHLPRTQSSDVQRYHMESFMAPHRYYYPWVVIEFYHTMTSRCEANPTALHFSIDGRQGILWASDITATLHLSVVLANTANYRQWPHPSTREMVRLLSMDATSETLLFRRHLPQRMLLIDHILRSNLFPLQHIVQRRGAIFEALYSISEGFWFSLTELIMTSLFHIEDRVHR